jgi:hypothetical protein
VFTYIGKLKREHIMAGSRTAARFVAPIYKPKGAPHAACYDNGLVDNDTVAIGVFNGFLNHRAADRTRHLSSTNDLPA